MTTSFNRDQLRAARVADLYAYLLTYHINEFTKEGDSLRFKANHSISVKQGRCSYTDFANGETGNSIDFLVRHLNYDVVTAVLALLGDSREGFKPSEQIIIKCDNTPKKLILPAPFQGRYRQLFAYLNQTRHISGETIDTLLKKELLYQEAFHNNIIFVNREKDWAEKHGSCSYTYSFHRAVEGSRSDGYWLFSISERPSEVFVCEGSIDAISLYELHLKQRSHSDAGYASIGGAGKQSALDRIKSEYNAILAVDKDFAGNQCRNRNIDIPFIVPQNKDWNEDLIFYKSFN